MDPVITVMTTVLTSGDRPSNDLAMQALPGLRTEKLVLLPRPENARGLLARAVWHVRRYRVQPWYVIRRLRRIGYGFDEVAAWPHEKYVELVLDLCGNEPGIAGMLARKQPSTGLFALCMGMADGRFDTFIISGMSFEITHDYAHNPLIEERGTTRSTHADTDVAVLRDLSRRYGSLFTTEPVVHQRTGLPLYEATIESQTADGVAG
jgi:hypothetical protein